MNSEETDPSTSSGDAGQQNAEGEGPLSSDITEKEMKNETNAMKTSSNSRTHLKQQAVKQKIEQYFQRLTQGCKKENCTNPNCASNPQRNEEISGNEAAVKAVQLLQKRAAICQLKRNNDKEESFSTSSSSTTLHETSASPMDCKTSGPTSNDDVPMETSVAESRSATVMTASNLPQLQDLPSTTSSAGTFVQKKIQAQTSKSGMMGSTLSGNRKLHPVLEVKEIKYLTEEMINDLLEQCKKDEQNADVEKEATEKKDVKDPYLPLVKIIGEVFSNIESLNRSFLVRNDITASPMEGIRESKEPEEMKMDVDPPPELLEDSEEIKDLGKSSDVPDSSPSTSDDGPFMSLLNSLVNGTSDVSSMLSMPTSSSTSDSGLIVPRVGESSGLHRTGAIRKKINVSNKKESNEKTVTVLTPTVDLEAVRRVYKKLTGIETVENALVNSLEILSIHVDIQFNVLHQLQKDDKSSTTLINLNMFVIVMENPALHSPEYLDKALPSFCKVMASLPLAAHVVLVNLWSTYDAEHLQGMVETLQQFLTYKLLKLEYGLDGETAEQTELHKNDMIKSAIKCIKLLYYASLLGGDIDEKKNTKETKKSTSSNRLDSFSSLMGYDDYQDLDGWAKTHWKDPLSEELGISGNDCSQPLVPLKEFVNELLNSNFDVYNDFTQFMVERNGKDQFTFMHYPFILNTLNKNTYLFYDNRIRMLSGRRMMVLQSILNGSALSPYLRLKIRRDHVIDDSLVRLEMIAEENPEDLRKQLYVEFEGEQGVDEGGVSKEFFQLVVEQIFNPDYGMFTYDETTHMFWFNAHSFENKAQFTLIGIVLGLAIYNNCILDVKFPSVVYKKIFGRSAKFEDMVDSHPVIYNSLKQLLEYEGDVENDMMAMFSIEYSDMFGINHTHELKEGGGNIPVTKENRKEYAKLYSDWLLSESISDQFNAFHRGFELVVSQSPLKHMFQPDELEILISGSQEYDFESLESSTDYDGGFTKDSETVKDFWVVVHDMSDEDKKKLLQFTTGTDRAPVGGLSQIKLVIARNGPDSERLPTAHTCFNVILLPDYRNRDKLKERLYKAIMYSKGFGML